MINGVLVERTVKDVKPALETNSEGLKKVLDDLVKQYKRQQEEMEKWKVSFMLPIKIFTTVIILKLQNNVEVKGQRLLTRIEFLEKEQHSSCATMIEVSNAILRKLAALFCSRCWSMVGPHLGLSTETFLTRVKFHIHEYKAAGIFGLATGCPIFGTFG